MPDQMIFLGKISSTHPAVAIPEQLAAGDAGTLIAVHFEGNRKGLLDLSYPPAAVWKKMIDYLRDRDRPAYAEIDPETGVITNLLMPAVAQVWQIDDGDGPAVYVIFHTSHARHYLRRNHPRFGQMLAALQAAGDIGAEVLVTATPGDFEIVDVRSIASPPGSVGPAPMPTPEPGPPPPIVPVTPARAADLFHMMKAQNCTPCASHTPCIPFRFPRDGCWIRAHLMCYLMVAQGETPEKIWIDGSLLAPTVNVPECQVPWGWHVAPTLMVTQAGGPDIKMVIDPSLCDGPVTPEVWKSLQGDPTAMLHPTSWDVYGHAGAGTSATQAAADSDMEYYRLQLDQMCATYGPSPYACPVAKRCYFIVDRSTISKDEVDAMLSTASPAVIDAAFYVVLEGFSPDELGITAAGLSGIPVIHPSLSVSPAVQDMTAAIMPGIGLEDTLHLLRRQRITWKYSLRFTGSNGFVSETEAVNLSASIAAVTAGASLTLIKQPNPYEIDGATAWLSTDLRVFQIPAGASRFNKTMGADAPGFITGVIQALNSGATGGETFESGISTDQQTSRLELSQTVNGVAVYNFAVAKVRYRALSVQAQDVRVFFRMFPALSTSLDYNQATTYRRAAPAGTIIPLLGINSGETATIPFFAVPRIDTSAVSMTQQPPDTPNVQTLPPNAAGQEVVRYFGCWLDINQTQPQFPVHPAPADGPYPAGSRKTIQELIRNAHQCLVAEIAFDPAPIPAGASPSVSDKLAQRNLAIVTSANPGDIASHRIPHTFEIRPTPAKNAAGDLPDELMIDWGNTPQGSTAKLYIPGIDANEVLRLAAETRRSHSLVRIDAHTLQCDAGGITWIPIPPYAGEAHYAGLLSVDLPKTVRKGQHFTIVAHQVTGDGRARNMLTQGSAAGIPEGRMFRRILGSFQISIPVKMKEEMLAQEARLLANLRWIQRSIPENNRWQPVFGRYVKQISSRVDALGGDAEKVPASPSDTWTKRPGNGPARHRRNAALLAALAGALLAGAFLVLCKKGGRRREKW